MRVSRRSLLGREVVSADGIRVGELQSLLIDSERWRVAAIEVRLDRHALESLDLRRPLLGTLSVRIPVSRVAAMTGRVVLRDAVEDILHDAPEHKRRTSPRKRVLVALGRTAAQRLSPYQLADEVALGVVRLNRAIAQLERAGLVRTGTRVSQFPYRFGEATLTAKGREAYWQFMSRERPVSK